MTTRTKWFCAPLRLLPVPSWDALVSIGRARSLRWLLIWMIVVPLLARLFSAVPDEIHVKVPWLQWPETAERTWQEKVRSRIPNASLREFGIPIPLSLPFSWKWFYYAGVAMLSADFLIGFACPRIIRKPPAYGPSVTDATIGEFLGEVCQTKWSDFLLGGRLWTSNNRYMTNDVFLNGLLPRYKANHPQFERRDERLRDSWIVAVRCTAVPRMGGEEGRIDALDLARLHGRWSGFYWRLWVTLLFLFAISSLIYVGYQNFSYVWNYS